MDVENKQAVEQEMVHTENALAEGIDLHSLEEEVYLLTGEFIEKAKLKKGQLFVVGCSTSEVLGEKIGTASSYSTAEALFRGIYRAANESDLFLCTQ